MELAEKRYAQWLAQQGLEPELRQELDAMHSDAEKVTDAFYRDLEFGTAGLRGIIGAGSNSLVFPHEVSNTEAKTNKIAIGVIFFI